MRNIIVTFFKVSGLSFAFGLCSFFLLALLFNDVLREVWILLILAVLLGGFMIFISYLVIYLPIYYLKKSFFEKETVLQLYERFLPIAILPISFIALVFMFGDPRDFWDTEVLFMFLLGYLCTFFSFYQFIRCIKN